MTAADVEGTADEIGSEVVRHSGPTLAVTPQVKAAELVERLSVIREAMETAMQRDVDYGVIPGTDKPALLKPGAEKLSVLFQLDVQLENEKVWGPGDHLTVISHATAYHAPTGTRLGSGEGMCSTREKKYGKRKQERVCPSCGVAAVIKGKAEYGGGWLCWKKRNGCGAKFPEGDRGIESQPIGEIENPDLADTWNTVLKMAEKRGRVDAVLSVTGASALFTQDIEENESADAPAPAPEPTPRDVKRTGESDVTPMDPWAESMKDRVAPFRGVLRDAFRDLGIPVPANVSSWGRFLGSLDSAERTAFTEWLTAAEERKAGVAWAEDPSPDVERERVDELAMEFDAEEVKAA